MTAPVPGPPRSGMFPRPSAPGQGQPGQGQPGQGVPLGRPEAGQATGEQSGPRPGPPAHRPRPDLAGQAGDGTGHPAVDAALQSLDNAAQLSPHQQVAAYEEAHRTLQETLASIDRT